ncbi:hypothetical protein ACCW76_04390 [Pantoea sp. C8B4]|uniref:hypothetical protein n=1 Tax=Pantoea sp. C8B4 TaxID=3243083 RepID=UPI003EDAC932
MIKDNTETAISNKSPGPDYKQNTVQELSETHPSAAKLKPDVSSGDVLPISLLALVLILVAIVYMACSWLRTQLDKLIEIKGIRLTFSVVILPLAVIILSSYFLDDNKKYLYLLALIISLVTSERSTALTVNKKAEEKDKEIQDKDAKIKEIKAILLDKIREFKSVHLGKLLSISNDRTPCGADDVRKQVHDFTTFMMFQSSFLYTIDEIEHKANSSVSPKPADEFDIYKVMFNSTSIKDA